MTVGKLKEMEKINKQAALDQPKEAPPTEELVVHGMTEVQACVGVPTGAFNVDQLRSVHDQAEKEHLSSEVPVGHRASSQSPTVGNIVREGGSSQVNFSFPMHCHNSLGLSH